MARKPRKKHWSWSVGSYGCRIRVYARADGNLAAEVRAGGRVTRRSLKHTDRERAKRWAKDEQARLALGGRRAQDRTPTLKRLCAAYLTHQTPAKRSAAGRTDDARRAALWRTLLGDGFDLSTLGRRHVESVGRLRASGAVDARGGEVPEAARRRVGPRAVASDLEFLRALCRWATTWTDEDGRYLLDVNPWRGFALPREKNPRRPTATDERYRRTRAQAGAVRMELRREGRRVPVPSSLPEILDLVHATGRRVSAVLRLRWEDLRLDVGAHGAVVWPADTDKTGRAWEAPLSAGARAAIDRLRRRQTVVLSPYLFPSPKHPRRPVSKDLASAWLRKAEALAALPKLDGGLWHPYRRKWAVGRKHLPDVDVARAGGWKDVNVLRTIYQAPDVETLQRVVDDAGEVREVLR